MIEELAPAKINLDLCITGRRPDGLHELDSLVVFTEFGDRLTMTRDDRLTLVASGPFAAALGAASNNLVQRAASLLAAHAGCRPAVRITLVKNIPVAAGIGGGSADAAATLRGLNRLWQLGLELPALAELALELGADLPVCLTSRPTWMRGIGERCDVIPELPELSLLLVNPRQPLATGAVFGALGAIGERPRSGPPPIERSALLAWLHDRTNHLELPAKRLLPQIDLVLARLRAQPGCELARMSGSGATCFGVFDGATSLAEAARTFEQQRPEWWSVPTRAAQG